MDPWLYLRALSGDEEAREELVKQGVANFCQQILALERMTGMRIEPGSFLLGAVYQANDGLNSFADAQHCEWYAEACEIIREQYSVEKSG